MEEDQSIFRHNDGLIVKILVNSPVNSNCYILYKEFYKSCLIIDPGMEHCETLFEFLTTENIHPEYIVLTHEHFDHVWSTNKVKDKYDAKIVCTSLCNQKIIDPKKNMSVFFDQIGFSIYPADICTEDISHVLKWNGFTIKFIPTSGHTDCSVTLCVNNCIFVGDLMIKGLKTVTKLPTGDKIKLQSSLSLIEKMFKTSETTVFPGHGTAFKLNEININHFL